MIVVVFYKYLYVTNPHYYLQRFVDNNEHSKDIVVVGVRVRSLPLYTHDRMGRRKWRDEVAEATGRDPSDPANWTAPEDADWEHVTQVSRQLCALLGPECDPWNTLHGESGGVSP